MKPEALLKAKMVDKLCELYPSPYVFRPVQMGLGASTLDIIACINGRFVAIEAKTPGHLPTPRQNAVIRAINEAGGVALWSDTVTDMLKTLEVARL